MITHHQCDERTPPGYADPQRISWGVGRAQALVGPYRSRGWAAEWLWRGRVGTAERPGKAVVGLEDCYWPEGNPASGGNALVSSRLVGTRRP